MPDARCRVRTRNGDEGLMNPSYCILDIFGDSFYMQKRNLKKNTYYHIYNRGNTKERLFFCEKDFERFGKTIARYLQEFPCIRIHVWSFLPNHFHFLLSEVEPGLEPKPSPDLEKMSNKTSPDSGSAISDFMRKIQQAYAMYFNSRYKELVKKGKKGPVFEGNFKAKEITDEEYLAQVSYYIRHNAVKHGIVEDIREWTWAGATVSEDFPGIDYVGLDTEFDPGFE